MKSENEIQVEHDRLSEMIGLLHGEDLRAAVAACHALRWVALDVRPMSFHLAKKVKNAKPKEN